MFDFVGFAVRNPSYVTKHLRRSWSVRKAMKKFREQHTSCAYCGRREKLHVHHVVPVSVSAELADKAYNMIMLCGNRCHLVIGHEGDYRNRYVENVHAVCKMQRTIKIIS